MLQAFGVALGRFQRHADSEQEVDDQAVPGADTIGQVLPSLR